MARARNMVSWCAILHWGESKVQLNLTVFVAAFLGLLNAVLMFKLNRAAKRNDEHEARHKRHEDDIRRLQGEILSEDRFRQILREELKEFELNLINEGRLDPKKQRVK